MRYRDAGVDIDSATDIVRGIGKLAPSTWGSQVLSDIGSFGGLYAAEGLGSETVLVSSIDGVGTKTQVARLAGKFDNIGIDMVHHSVNDVLVQGARPLFFLDYIAASKLEKKTVLEVIAGMASACREHQCALIGGETAEMPGTYQATEYDIVGCIVGVAKRSELVTGENVRVGDEVWGLPSNGLHTNGFSLARRVLLERAQLDLHSTPDGFDCTLADSLLSPHRSYFAPLWPLIQEKQVHAMAHITGGGFIDNIPRLLPKDCDALIDPTSWEIPVLFKLIAELGDVPANEMRRVFNLGIGMVVLLPAAASSLLQRLEPGAVRIGDVIKGSGRTRFTDD